MLMRTLARTRKQRLHLAWYRWRKHMMMLAQALRSHATNISATRGKRTGKDVASTHPPAPSAEAKSRQSPATTDNPDKPTTANSNTRALTSSAREYSRRDHVGVHTTTRMFTVGANSRRKQVWAKPSPSIGCSPVVVRYDGHGGHGGDVNKLCLRLSVFMPIFLQGESLDVFRLCPSITCLLYTSDAADE